MQARAANPTAAPMATGRGLWTLTNVGHPARLVALTVVGQRV